MHHYSQDLAREVIGVVQREDGSRVVPLKRIRVLAILERRLPPPVSQLLVLPTAQAFV